MSSSIKNEQDLLDAFHQLAEWFAKKNMCAHVMISGGSSLILQTHLRDERGTKDIDLAFAAVTCPRSGDKFPYSVVNESNGRGYLPILNQNNLFNDTLIQNPTVPLDDDYWRAFADFYFDRPEWKECRPCISMLDEHGNGLEVRLVTIDHIANNKSAGLRADRQNTEPGEYTKLLHDAYGIYALKKWRWDHRTEPPAHEAEKIVKRADLGFKPLPYRDIRIEL